MKKAGRCALPLFDNGKARVGRTDVPLMQSSDAAYTWTKRVIDVTFAFIALVILMPVLLVVAVGVKMDSTGPVVFRQKRVGRYGNPFIFYKFRSMEVGAEDARAEILHLNEAEAPLFKMRNDPRVTRLGRWIRKYAVDEIPQLVNVLKGDMSFVGPRPHLPEEARQYTPEQSRRLSVIPGITCLWQVSGPKRISFHEWIAADLEYVNRRCLSVDLAIVLRTIKVVLTGEGTC
ncbi:MAG: sugar transferase [Candidatus Eisenbacteria sp.]|nr:sugar transferase [Candidatus Eisenbacteria bacterium]